MNVDKTSFTGQLPTILKRISDSHLVAFDLELSGIPSKRRRDTQGKQNLQERYQELKHAAEKFHVLQVGLTCVEEDVESQSYVIRPYNFNISPLIGHGIDVEREFTYSTGAVDFLLDHGYQMDAPYRLGVPYLSRSEAKCAEERAKLRWDRGSIPDIKLDASDKQALSFMQRVRDEINSWQRAPKLGEKLCFIRGSLAPTSENSKARLPLNGFERRLVHQLVRAEYPKLSTSSKGDYMQILLKDEREEASHKNSLQRRLDDSLFLQTGFRWVSEALIGGDLSGISPNLCGPRIAGEIDAPNTKQFARRLEELSSALRSRKIVLVGHNCFLDLVYFYKTFVGDLPATVQGFQDAVREIFPLVLDTKYMATAIPDGGPFRSSQLWQIDEALSNSETPNCEIPSDHPSYVSSEQYHEAGFDSYATAKVFLRLAMQLKSAKPNEEKLNTESPEKPLVEQSAAAGAVLTADNIDLFDSCETSLNNSSDMKLGDEKTKKKPNRKTKTLSTAKGMGENRFFSANAFDSLKDIRDSDEHIQLSAETRASSSNAIGPDASVGPAAEINVMTSPFPPSSNAGRNDKLLPPWDTDIWKAYGNKLRVYGTVEEVCDLSKGINQSDEVLDVTDASPAEASGSARRPSLLASLVDKCKNLLI